MKLADWLLIPEADGRRKRRREFAAKIGVSPTMITLYCEQDVVPTAGVLRRIFDATGGEVTANDFVHTDQQVA